MPREALKSLRAEVERLRLRLAEAEGALDAIRQGHVESLVVEGPEGPRVFSLEGASHSYRVLVEAMTEGAATLSEERAILYCNARFAEMLGAPLERVMGSNLHDWVPGSCRSDVEDLVRDAEDAPSRGELNLLPQDGRELPVQLSIRSFHDHGRRLLCLVATDLSQQKKNEQVLAEGRLARSVLEQAAEAIVVCDERGRVTRASRTAEQICGCSPLRADFDAAFPVVLSSPLLGGSVASTALSGAVIRAEAATLTRVDGTRADLLVSATPLQGPEARIVGCVVTMVDVSEYRRADEELRAAEERLRTLGDNLPEGALFRYSLDANGRPRFLHISAGIERLTGVSAPEILRRPAALYDTVVEEDRERLAAAQAHSRQTMTNLDLEIRQRHRATGELRSALMRAVPRLLGDGSTVWDGFLFDITARRKAEDSLREADKDRLRFLAQLSHELRNPLAPLRNSVYLLAHASPADEEARRALGVLQRQVDTLSRLVDDLLDVTRMTSGKMQLQREPIDLREVVKKAIEDHRPAFDEAGVALHVSLPPSALPTTADATRLSQVVGNLLQNAVKFTPHGGETEISLERDPAEDGAVLRVRDTGLGISPEDLKRLFRPFYQAGASTDRGGLGLGLSLVKGIVELHGGRVAVASEGRGRGAELLVHLPLEAVPVETAVLRRRETPAACPRRVLIVEDNPDSADSLRSVLELDSHVVEIAHSAAEGIAKASELLPDVVLCDIGLPLTSGYEVARVLRSRLKGTFLVALSGYATPEDVQRASEAGFDEHIAKPPSLDALRRTIAACGSPRQGSGDPRRD